MYDIAVIGGGMAGASLACGLAKENASIALVEERQPGAADQQSYDDRGIALSISSRKIFEAMGLWSKLEHCPIERIHVSTQGGYGCVRMSAGQLGLDALGYVVSARELGRKLFEEIINYDNIDMFCPAAATGIKREGDSVEVRLKQADGHSDFSCKLLVVADGAFSGSRELLGIKANIHDYREAAIVSNVTVSRDHDNTAYERFTADGLIALLPLAGNRCVTVMIVPGDETDSYLQMGNDEYLDHLQQRVGKRLGKLSRPGARKSYPLFLLEPEQQTTDRVVLLGNAAHTIHPNGAQGFNLALRDVAGLIEHIASTLRNGGDVGAREVLTSYILSREKDQRQVIRFTDALHEAFDNGGPLKSIVRNTAMFILDALPVLKKEFIRRRTGVQKTGDRRQKTAGGGRRAEIRGLGTEYREQKSEYKGQGAEEQSSVLSLQSSATCPLKTELLIVGGGVIGSSMALLSALSGVECVLVERNTTRTPAAESPAEDPRVLALSLASQKILSEIRVWQQLSPSDTGRFERMHVWDENGNGRLDFDCADVNQSTLGYTVRQNVLVKALEAVRDKLPAITVCPGVEVVSLSPDVKSIRLELSDGRKVSTKLLIAADGARSKIRQLAGIDYDTHQYKQTAVASIVRTELPHEHVARQRFLRNGPIAFLPLADQTRCGLVWSTTPGQAAELLAMDEPGFQRALADAFDNRLGAIVQTGVRQSFPLQRAQARHYCSDRIALIGDAAHCVHPLAGLGANLGLLDAASLFQVIGEARMKQRDFGSMTVLRKYERWRKGENFTVMMALEGLKYLFENQTSPLPPLRNAGMNLFNSLPALKNLTMRRATGLDGDLPGIVKNA